MNFFCELLSKSLSTDLEEFLKVANEKYDDQTLENSDTDTHSFDPKSKVSKLPPQSENSDSDAPEIPTEDFIEGFFCTTFTVNSAKPFTCQKLCRRDAYALDVPGNQVTILLAEN